MQLGDILAGKARWAGKPKDEPVVERIPAAGIYEPPAPC